MLYGATRSPNANFGGTESQCSSEVRREVHVQQPGAACRRPTQLEAGQLAENSS